MMAYTGIWLLTVYHNSSKARNIGSSAGSATGGTPGEGRKSSWSLPGFMMTSFAMSGIGALSICSREAKSRGCLSCTSGCTGLNCWKMIESKIRPMIVPMMLQRMRTCPICFD